MDLTFDFEATRIPQIKQNKEFGLQNKPETNTYDRDLPNTISCICRKDILGAT